MHGIILSSHIPEQTQHGEDTKSNEELNKNKRITLAEVHGICELCSTPAPFKDKSGNPYLLATMIIPSVYGGTNMLNNLVALCPNCAAKMDIRADDTDIAYLRNKKSNIL
jgi:5-methylcytosine-specific restriction endonuclease McrA